MEMRENMKSILYSACIGTLALVLTTGGAQAAKDKRSEIATPQHRSGAVHTARPATAARPASAMPATARAHRNVSAAQYPQRSYAKPRTSSSVSRAPRQASATRARASRPASRTPATVRPRRDIAAANQPKRPASDTSAAARERNSSANHARNLAANRDRNVAVNRTTNADVNRFHNNNEFRGRNNVAINRNRNVAVNRTGNAAYYRGGNARVTNNWRGDAFRGQRYAALRNYNRQWHPRSWWRR